MGLFKDDLIKWKEGEERVLEILIENWFNLIKNPKEKEMDLLIIDNVPWIEVKTDEKAQYSWNFYIEFECNGKESWLFRPEKYHLKYWAHTDKVKLYLLEWDQFKTYVSEKIANCRSNKSNTRKWFRVVEFWGNWGLSKWLLIPRKIMEEIAYKIYSYE